MTATYVVGDVRDCLAATPDASVDLVLTSPPFLALRSYLPADHPDKAREIGSEPTPAEFLDTLLGLSAEWRRVLTPYGSMVVELGDTYAGSGGAGGDYNPGGWRHGENEWDGSSRRAIASKDKYGGEWANPGYSDGFKGGNPGGAGWPLAKSLTLIPELYRVALAYGRHPLTGQESPAGQWRVRNVVRWVRPNPPVGALGDKFRPATSDLVVACTSGKRWFDLDAVRTHDGPGGNVTRRSAANRGHPGHHTADDTKLQVLDNPAGAPPLDWWQISPGGYQGSHYAVFPPELCVRPVEAMCPRRVCRTCGEPSRRVVDLAPGPNIGHPGTDGGSATVGGHPNGHRSQMGERQATTTGWSSCGCPGTDGIRLDGYHTGTGWRPGIVLDPFAGSGTTLMVATGHGRDALGFDLDERNADLARERIGMFLETTTLEDWSPRVA